MKTNLYPIKAVSVKTGLTIHVIRAWEKRYQAVTPDRTETNRRLYSEQDIRKLQLLKQLTQEGHNIGNVASLDLKALKELISESPQVPSAQRLEIKIKKNEISPIVDECITAIKNFKDKSFEKILLNASYKLSQTELLNHVIIPLVYKVGKLWHDGDIRIMHEHMATAILKSFLSNMRNNYRVEENAPSIIITTPLGQNHEIGALIQSVVAVAEGWKVIYLGPNLPANEIASAVAEKKAIAILLSIVYPADDHNLKLDLMKLKPLLPKDTYIFVGGRLAKNYKTELDSINALIIDDIAEFRKESRSIRNLY